MLTFAIDAIAVSPADVVAAEMRALGNVLDAVASNRFRIMAGTLAHLDSKLIVTGVGKSGIVARKIAATLATCGVSAVFIDPTQLAHGELGAIRAADVVLMISQSGETAELTRLLPSLPSVVFTIVGNASSTLGQLYSLATGCTEEPFAEIPTASSAAAVAIGDALAVTVAQLKKLDKGQLRAYHPGNRELVAR